jgi:hypothetical protein
MKKGAGEGSLDRAKNMVGRRGFEPLKAEPADLQSGLSGLLCGGYALNTGALRDLCKTRFPHFRKVSQVCPPQLAEIGGRRQVLPGESVAESEQTIAEISC